MAISSPHNARLKQIRKLRMRKRERERERLFVAEGEDLLAAADAAGWQARERYVAAGSGLAGTEVEARLLESASGLASGTRALAVYEERWLPTAAGPVCIYLHGVHDPGNVGAVLRCAEAFGAACVALGPGCADPFGPKAVRASMGAIFAVPVARADSPKSLPGTTVALVPRAGVALHELPRPLDAVTLMIGAERDGLPDEVVAAAALTAHVPIDSHSLNAAMASAVALYEIRRMAAQP
jgi:TrmH family RNA methyltransferase